jgi:hypothetical protein
MIHTDEDDEFERIARENALHEVYRLGQEIEESGQPYHFEGVYVSASQRNQVLEEAARVADAWSGHHQAEEIAKEIRSLKK